MKFQKQLNLHKPEEGVWGDCFRTVLACFLDLHPAAVPHFMDKGLCDEEALPKAQAWLRAEHGLRLIETPYTECTLADVLTSVSHYNKGAYWMLTGLSRTGCAHVVICKDGEIVWDPSLTDAGIVGPYEEWFWATHLGSAIAYAD